MKPLATGWVGLWIEEGRKGWNGRTDGWMDERIDRWIIKNTIDIHDKLRINKSEFCQSLWLSFLIALCSLVKQGELDLTIGDAY